MKIFTKTLEDQQCVAAFIQAVDTQGGTIHSVEYMYHTRYHETWEITYIAENEV